MNREKMQSCFFGNSLRPFIFIMLAVLLLQAGCDKATANVKEAPIPMETYYIGRFSIAVPIEMKQTARAHKLRHVEIKEVVWPNDKNEHARREAWNNFLEEVKKLDPPDGTVNVIIKRHDFQGMEKWAKGIFYHDRNISSRTASWKVFMDAGRVGVWFKGVPVLVEKELAKPKMLPNISNIGKSYSLINTNTPRPKDNSFYLQYGAIKLPYDEQESSYVRFEGHPLKLKLELKMNETYKVEPGINERTSSEKSQLMARLLGVSVDRLRTGKRVVAGLEGEEELDRLSDKKGKTISFDWEYVGKENSGEHPRILISMESSDDNLDEKLKIWDAVLNSMQPMYK